MDPRRWLDEPPKIEKHGGLWVLRDDLLAGGSKLHFLPFLAPGSDELVFGGPFCGGAPLALSVMGKESGRRVTIFYAKRKERVHRQHLVVSNGAQIIEVDPGYMTNVQAKARKYAEEKGAFFLPLGFDLPAATEPFVAFMAKVREVIGDPPEVWCATGSGMLARCLGAGFPSSQIRAVCVGLKSRHSKQEFSSNVSLMEHPLDFARMTKAPAPFPSCPNYDRKAWEICAREAKPGALFWNVLGE